jgi:hypothetical protein
MLGERRTDGSCQKRAPEKRFRLVKNNDAPHRRDRSRDYCRQQAPQMSTYAEHHIPLARTLRRRGYQGDVLALLKAHNREIKRGSATVWNWGRAVSEKGITTKTNAGILETRRIRNGFEHEWNRGARC